MTKIMTFGAAALCAAVSLADVTSANVVGYSNYPLADGTCMAGAAFNKITASEKTTLTQIKPQGYLESTVYKNVGKGTKRGCNGEITVTFLDNAGATCVDKAGNEMKYYWKHTYYKTGGWDTDQHWYQMKPDGSTIDIDKNNAPEIKMGQGLWVKVEAGWNADFYIEGPGVDDTAAE